MSVPFMKTTDLSVSLTVNGRTVYVYDVGEDERITWGFNAEEAVTDVDAKLLRVNLDTTFDDVSTKIEAAALTGQIANITVKNFVRGEFYLLAVYFTNAVGRIWPRTLMIRCVA